MKNLLKEQEVRKRYSNSSTVPPFSSTEIAWIRLPWDWPIHSVCSFEFTFWPSDLLGCRYGPIFNFPFCKNILLLKAKKGLWYIHVSLGVQLENTAETHRKDWQHYDQIYKPKYSRSIDSIPFELLRKLSQILQHKIVEWYNWFKVRDCIFITFLIYDTYFVLITPYYLLSCIINIASAY